MNRDELERKVWFALRDLHADRHPWARGIVSNILDAADLYATTREVAFHAALAADDNPAAVSLRREVLEEAISRRAS